jgi:hypothetical protein
VVVAPEQGESMNDLFLKLHLAARAAFSSENGQSMSEYAMAVALIAFGCVAGEAAIASSVNHTFVVLATTITSGILH